MYLVVLFVIAILCATVHLFVSKKKVSFKRIIEILLAYIIPFSIGIASLLGFIFHAFFGPETAARIGWPPNNPFQFEVAIGNLAMSVAGFLAIWQRRGFWMATTIFSGVFSLGAAYGHIVQMLGGNHAPYNSGVFLYLGDIVIPIIYLVLTGIYTYQNKFFRNEYSSL